MTKDKLPDKITITVPPAILREFDQLTKNLFTNRSALFTRIYLEWKRANPQQFTPTFESPELEQVAQ